MCTFDWENVLLFLFAAGADYFPVIRTLVFRIDGGGRICVNISIINDHEQNEFYEVFLVHLSSTDIPIFSDQAVITILDQG